MSEMVERVADACQAVLKVRGMNSRPHAKQLARAAIEAMREPTDAMLVAAIAPYRNGNTAQFDDIMRSTILGYLDTMIDEALAATPPSTVVPGAGK